MWEKVIEKTIDTKAKTSLQLLFRTKEINFKYLKGYNLSAKKNKDKAT